MWHRVFQAGLVATFIVVSFATLSVLLDLIGFAMQTSDLNLGLKLWGVIFFGLGGLAIVSIKITKTVFERYKTE